MKIKGNHVKEAVRQIKKDKYLLLLVIPGMLFYFLFRYLPMGGLVIAFKDFSIIKGIWQSPWVGFDNFRDVFTSTDFWLILRNTVMISLYKLIFGFPAPIILALVLNEVRSNYFKRIVQTVVYLPHFISWVVISGIMLSILSPNYGVAGEISRLFGQNPINLMSSVKHFWTLLVVSDIWKEMGWGSIIYFAAISTIDPSLYEAAVVDGAGKLKRALYITLPSISGTIVLLLILHIGRMLSAGFEQILVMQNDLVRPISDVFETFAFRKGLQRGDYSFATALEFFKSVVACALIYSSDKIAKKIGEEGIL